jgi:hypothetical protein
VLTAAHCALACLNIGQDSVQVAFGTNRIDRIVHPAARVDKVIVAEYNKSALNLLPAANDY